MFQSILITGSLDAAAKENGLNRRQVRNMFKNPVFSKMFEEHMGKDELQTTQHEFNMLADDTVGIYEQAMNAEFTKKVSVTCPSCNHKFDVFTKVIDWATKLKATDTLLKLRGLLKDNKSIKVEGEFSMTHVQLSTGEFFALERLKRGLPVPDHVYRSLEEKARIGKFDLPALPAGQEIIEGEVHEIDTDPEF